MLCWGPVPALASPACGKGCRFVSGWEGSFSMALYMNSKLDVGCPHLVREMWTTGFVGTW